MCFPVAGRTGDVIFGMLADFPVLDLTWGYFLVTLNTTISGPGGTGQQQGKHPCYNPFNHFHTLPPLSISLSSNSNGLGVINGFIIKIYLTRYRGARRSWQAQRVMFQPCSFRGTETDIKGLTFTPFFTKATTGWSTISFHLRP